MKPWWTFVALAATPLQAQDAVPPAATPPSNYADMQREQGWATAKLARSPRSSRWVKLQMGDRTLRAFVTFPQKRGKVPVVIVPHEVFGLTDSTRNTADQIAALGYITIAPDMASGLAPNGGGVSDFTLPASSIMTLLPTPYANAQFDAWAAYGLKLPQANGKLAIVGLSWGGGAAFRYAAGPHHPALRLVNVLYDVGPPTVTQGIAKFDKSNPPISVTGIDVPIRHFIPSLDSRVVKSAAATKAAMAAAGKDYEQIILDGADHAYMRLGEDPANGNAANRAAVTRTFADLRALLSTM
jgi:carboxymethylenebutenolidase